MRDKFSGLHQQEELLRRKAVEWIAQDLRLSLHLTAVEGAMDLAYLLRQIETQDENLKVVQMLAMRAFNAFGSSLKLTLSGYSQNGALILRDVLETTFLLDLFQYDRKQIEEWRTADERVRRRDFAPARVRKILDDRDGFTSKKREAIYKIFSELAGHPSMKSIQMMRPYKHGDAVVGPFMEKPTLEAIVSEMGRLAIQVGEQLNLFFPADWEKAVPSRLSFAHAKGLWLEEFYSRKTL